MRLVEYNRSMQQENGQTAPSPQPPNLFSFPFQSSLALSTIMSTMSLFKKGRSDCSTVNLEVGFASLDIYLC